MQSALAPYRGVEKWLVRVFVSVVGCFRGSVNSVNIVSSCASGSEDVQERTAVRQRWGNIPILALPWFVTVSQALFFCFRVIPELSSPAIQNALGRAFYWNLCASVVGVSCYDMYFVLCLPMSYG